MANPLQEKIWGTTRCDINTPFYSSHLLAIDRGGFSSMHYHRNRANKFRIVRGTVEIFVAFGLNIERHLLTDGNELIVPSLVVHGFAASEDASMVEEYYPDRGGRVSIDDIVRLCHGGKLTDLEMPCDNLPERLLAEGFNRG